MSFQVFPDDYLAFSSTPFTVTARRPREYTWDTTGTDGAYAFSIYSNDGFVRSFAGHVAPSGNTHTGLPRVEVDLLQGHGSKHEAQVRLTLHNDGDKPVRYTLKANDHLGGTRNLTVEGGKANVVMWPTQQALLRRGHHRRHRHRLDAALRRPDRHGRRGLICQDGRGGDGHPRPAPPRPRG